mmetsp:Transcript_51378/g.142229  ORF Transcript_51378/g.142229 Transcript_51378/m.142229 type:complete len:113 (+) Transcript_51378:201-539(+)
MSRRKGAKATEEVEETKFAPVTFRHVDMADEMRDFVAAAAQEAQQKFKIEKDMATHVKKKMDEKEGGTWHAIAGQSYGVSLTHETQYLVFFTVETTNFCVFKTIDDDTPVEG